MFVFLTMNYLVTPQNSVFVFAKNMKDFIRHNNSIAKKTKFKRDEYTLTVVAIFFALEQTLHVAAIREFHNDLSMLRKIVTGNYK